MAKKEEAGFSAAEKEAMKARAAELKAEAKAGKDRAAGEKAVQEKIAEMEGSDQKIAKRLHELITQAAPELMPRTWYGMQAYAKDGKVLCFFQASKRFDTRYSTLGFNDVAQLDDGAFWPTAYAVMSLDKQTEERIVQLIKKAVA